MAAHKKIREDKTPEEFWSKVLAAPKVKRILEKARDSIPEAFRRDYEADTSRGPRIPEAPQSKQQMDAVEAFSAELATSRR